MLPRRLLAAAVLALAAGSACGSSDDAGPGLDASQAETEPTDPTDQTDVTEQTTAAQQTTTTTTTTGGGNGEAENGTPGEVGAVIEGVAVATSAGGDEACQARPEGLLPPGVVEGAPVTIRDASSEEVIGTGEVTSTEFVQLTGQTTEGGLPPWICTFFIAATVSSTPGSITVQVADLTPVRASFDPSRGFSIDVPSEGTEPQPDTTSSSEPSSSTTENGSTSSTVDSEAPTESTEPPDT